MIDDLHAECAASIARAETALSHRRELIDAMIDRAQRRRKREKAIFQRCVFRAMATASMDTATGPESIYVSPE